MSHRTERRHQKKPRERIETPPISHGASAYVSDGSQRDFELSREPADTATDLRLVRRAVNRDWDVPSERRNWIIEPVTRIVRQESGASEFESDQNSILACATMLDTYIAAFRSRKRSTTPQTGLEVRTSQETNSTNQSSAASFVFSFLKSSATAWILAT